MNSEICFVYIDNKLEAGDAFGRGNSDSLPQSCT